eukprot:961129_1
MAGYWDFDTSYEFLIHFDSEQYPCTYIHYTSNCSFMTFNPTAVPTQSSLNPSYDPSQSPTNNPSENTSQPTHGPSLHPSSQPTEAPIHDPSTHDPTDTNDTVSITITCRGSGCHFDDETVDTVTNIIIAYLNEDARIIGTEVTSKKVSIVIANADSNTLDKDMITKDIEVRLKERYGNDVDVAINDPGGVDEDVDEDDSNIGIMIGSVVFLFALILVCTYFYSRRSKRIKQVKKQEIIMADVSHKTQRGTSTRFATRNVNRFDVSLDGVLAYTLANNSYGRERRTTEGGGRGNNENATKSTEGGRANTGNTSKYTVGSTDGDV